MTASERAAYRWLLARRGYTSRTLRFQRRASPDFLGSDGRAWEVKLVRNRSVLFTAAQIVALGSHQRCMILLWSDGARAPEAIVPFRALHPLPSVWRQYRILVARTPVLAPRAPIPTPNPTGGQIP